MSLSHKVVTDFFNSFTVTLINKFTSRLATESLRLAQMSVVAMATRVGPTTFCMVSLNLPSPKTP